VTGRFDARELFRVLNEHEVDHVTIGGIAVQAHGGQRVTQDLDVAVASSRANYDLLTAALEELDARTLGRTANGPNPYLRHRSLPLASSGT